MEERVIPKDIPAGHKRDEAMRKVTDDLAKEMEEAAEKGPLVGSFDPEALEIDNEIAVNYNFQYNEFEVTDKVPGYSYLWIYDPPHETRTSPAVGEVLSRVQRFLGNRVPGYERVSGPMPECRHLKDAEGNRRIGDAILFRVPTKVAQALESKFELMARAREVGVSGLFSLADRHPDYVKVREFDGDPKQFYSERLRRGSGGGISRQEHRQKVIEDLAMEQMVRDIKAGRLKGMPAPGQK